MHYRANTRVRLTPRIAQHPATLHHEMVIIDFELQIMYALFSGAKINSRGEDPRVRSQVRLQYEAEERPDQHGWPDPQVDYFGRRRRAENHFWYYLAHKTRRSM